MFAHSSRRSDSGSIEPTACFSLAIRKDFIARISNNPRRFNSRPVIERLARAMHGQRDGRAAFVPDTMWVASVGMNHEGFARLMRALGYRLRSVDGQVAFEWRGPRSRHSRPDRRPTADRRSPFAVLAGLAKPAP